MGDVDHEEAGGGGGGNGGRPQNSNDGLVKLFTATLGSQQQRGGRHANVTDKALLSIPGPWNGHALVGSIYDYLNKSEIRRAPYKFGADAHPVKLLHKQLRPAAGSPVSLYIRQMKNARVHQEHINQPNELSSFIAPYDENTADKWFSSGEIAYHDDKVNGVQEYYHMCLFVPQDYLKENAATLFDFRDNNDWIKEYAQMTSFVVKAMSNMSVGVSSRRAGTQSGIGTGYFRTSDGNIVQRVRCIVEVMFLDDSVNDWFEVDPNDQSGADNFRPMPAELKSQACSAHNIVGYRIHWIILDPTLHPAASFKTQVWINDRDRCRSKDPEGDLATRLRYSVHSKRRAAFLRRGQEMAHDPNLTANLLVGALDGNSAAPAGPSAAEELRNAAAAAAPPHPDAAMPLAGAPHPDAAMPADGAADDAADDGGDAPGAALNPEAPLVAAANAAERAMIAAVTNQGPHPDDDGASDDNWGDQAEEVDGPDPDESEEAAEARGEDRAQKKEKAEKKKKQEAAKKQLQQRRMNNGSKKSADDVYRSRMAETISEPTPKTYFRNVFTLERLSRLVYHVYNQAADSEMARDYANGIYAPGGDATLLQDDDYDLHSMSSPMWYGFTFSFANSVRVAAAAAARKRRGQVDASGIAGGGAIFRAANSVQADINQYWWGPNRYLAMPFPYAAFEYAPRDLDPEINCDFELPWKMSGLDVMLDTMEQKIHRRKQHIIQRQAQGEDFSDLVNSPTQLFSNRDSIDVLLGANVAHGDPTGSGVGYAKLGLFDRMRNAKPLREESLITEKSTAEIRQNISKAEDEYQVGGVPSQRIVTPWGISGITDREGSSDSATATATESHSTLRRSASESSERQRRLTSARNNTKGFEAQEVLRRVKRTREVYQRRGEEAATDTQQDSEAVRRATRETSRRNTQMLSELLGQISESDGSGTVQASPEKLDEVYKSVDPVHRQALEILRRMTDAPVSDSLAYDLQMGAQGKIARNERIREGDSASSMGRTSDLVRQKLATNVTEGPIAKSERRVTKKIARIMKVVASMPCKNEKDAVTWLALQRPWIVEQRRKEYEKEKQQIESVDGDPLPPFNEAQVEVKWTPQLEDLYRRQEMTRLMGMLYEEASVECFGQLSLSNQDLSSLHKGMLLAMEERGSDVYFAPAWSIDLSMTRWSNSVAHEMLMLDSVCNVHQAHLMLFEMYKSFRVNVMRHGLKMGTNILMLGPPGTEKSHTQTLLHLGSIASSMVAADHTSKLAAFTNKAEDYFMEYLDEAPDYIIGDVAKMNREQRQRRDQEKAQISKGNASYSRNVESKDSKERITETRVVSRIKGVWACTNRIEHTDENSMLNRFRKIYGIAHRRADVSLAERVTMDRANVENNDANNFHAAKRDEHIVVGVAVALQNLHGLPKVGTELMRIMMAEGEKELNTFTSFQSNARASQRAFNDVEAYAINKIYDRQFCSEDSPFPVWSKERDAIVDVRPLALNDFKRLFGSGLYTEYDQCVFAMTRFFSEFMDLRVFEIIFAAVHRYGGFTRDFFSDVYRRYADKIQLPDVEKRARERGFASADDDSSVLKEFHQYERELRSDAAKLRPQHPHMPVSKFRDGEELEADRLATASGEGKAKKHVPRSQLWSDPTYISIPCQRERAYEIFAAAVANDFETLDISTISSILKPFCHLDVRHPRFKRVQDPRSEKLEFEGAKAVYDKEKQCWRVEGELIWESSPIMKWRPLATSNSGYGHILIPTHFLMNPWHYVLQLYLTRHENKHTRSLKCLLPLTRRGRPQMLHHHYVRPRPDTVLRTENPHFVPERMRSAINNVDTSGFAHALASHHVRANQTRSAHASQMITFDVDPEFYGFTRHLMDMNYLPENISPQADAIWLNPKLSPAERFIQMAKSHPHRPGATEERIHLRRTQWKYFTENAATKERTVYPDTFDAELEFNLYVKRADKERDRRANKERLSEEELEEYHSKILTEIFVEQPRRKRQAERDVRRARLQIKRNLERREREASLNKKISAGEREERAKTADAIREEVEKELAELKKEEEADSRAHISTLYTQYAGLKDAALLARNDEIKKLVEKLLENPGVRDRAVVEDWQEYLRLSQIDTVALTPITKTKLEGFKAKYGVVDFVIEYIIYQLRQKDAQTDANRRSVIDQYARNTSRLYPVQEEEMPQPPSGDFYTPSDERFSGVGGGATNGNKRPRGLDARDPKLVDAMLQAAANGEDPLQVLNPLSIVDQTASVVAAGKKRAAEDEASAAAASPSATEKELRKAAAEDNSSSSKRARREEEEESSSNEQADADNDEADVLVSAPESATMENAARDSFPVAADEEDA